jgi:hypothetical protein
VARQALRLVAQVKRRAHRGWRAPSERYTMVMPRAFSARRAG